MFKRILSIFVAMTFVSTSYAQLTPDSQELKRLPEMVNTVLKKVTMIEDRGYYIQNREGKKVAFADLVANRKHFGNSFSVFAPISKIENGKVNKAFQFKAQIQIDGAQIGVKIIDALDESVLGRTVLEIPIQDSAIVENSLSIKALETQVAQSLRASNKIAKNEMNSKRTVAEIFLSSLIPKAHALTSRDTLYGLQPLNYNYGRTECRFEHWDGFITYLQVLFSIIVIGSVFTADRDKIKEALARHKKIIFAILSLPVLLIAKSSLECKD